MEALGLVHAIVTAIKNACNQLDSRTLEVIKTVHLKADSQPVKLSGKFGQRAKVYPTRTNGCENVKTTELFRPV